MKINNPNTDIKAQFETQIEKLAEEKSKIYIDRLTIIRDSLFQFIESEFFDKEIQKIVLENHFVRIEFVPNSLCKYFQIEYTNNWKFDEEGRYTIDSFINPKIEWGRNGGDYLDYCIEIGELSKIIKSKQDKLDIFKEYIVKYNNIHKDPEYKSIAGKIEAKKQELNNIESTVRKNQEQIIFNQGYIEKFNKKSVEFKTSSDLGSKRRWRRDGWNSGDKFTFTKNPSKKTFTVTKFYKHGFHNDKDEYIEETRSHIVRDNCREEYVWASIRNYIHNKNKYESKIKKQSEVEQD